MPAAPSVRPIVQSDLPAISELLAARHRADATRLAFLEPALSEPAGARAVLEALVRNPRADGVVAEEHGSIIGFLFGERMDLAPTDMASLFIPPHSVALPIEGHAVAAGSDATVVYRAMYAALAGRWASDGYFIHRAAIPAGDAVTQEAWVSLGFGRYLTAATRPTTPVKGHARAGVDIRRASPEELDDVMFLAEELNAHHSRSPMFWPVLGTTEDSARAFNAAALRSATVPYFVAYEAGVPVGMQTFLRPGFTPPIINQSHDVYLFEGIVSESVRGSGMGTALLSHAMEWARSEGTQSCTLHFASGNPTGGPFWLGQGFVPVEHTMERRLDERIAWAKPKSQS